MNKFNIKTKKKRGFTLIEIISVIAMICILIVALLPKFNGYITKAKKLAVISQARKVVMAAESYNMEGKSMIGDTEEVSSIKSGAGKEYLEEESLDKLPDTMTLASCRKVVNGAEFSINNGVFSDIDKANPSSNEENSGTVSN